MHTFPKVDLIVIGGGILGTFHAYHALKAGKKVCLIEKDGQALGATVRNFGQIVPSGMNKKWQSYGRKSLHTYKELQAKVDLTFQQNGSFYLASNEEELNLLIELQQINLANDYPSNLLTKAACLERFPNLKADYCIGGLHFPEELSVDPRQMIHRLHQYLAENFDYTYHTNTTVIGIDSNDQECEVRTNKNGRYQSEKVILCNGSAFQLLYPNLFEASDLELVKLQMLATFPQQNIRIKGNILTGLTIRRYESFHECPSYAAIKAKEAQDALWKKWGIHILFKQSADGSVIIGDSHEYFAVKNQHLLSFDIQQEINNHIIELAKEIFELNHFQIQKQWIGIYSQCQTKDIFQHSIDNRIHIVTGIGGKGMTGSAGFAEENIKNIFNTEINKTKALLHLNEC
jgi:FAD dependent oxidoreductase TIGR03364